MSRTISAVQVPEIVIFVLCALSLAQAAPHPDARAQDHPPYQVNGKVLEPQLFAEGVISTVDDEIGGSFSPDGSEFYFTRLVPYTTAPRVGIMCVSHFANGRWNPAEALPFSGNYLDLPPRFDPSGKKMLFASSRPLPDGTRGGIRIWEVERDAVGWGQPRVLPPPINPAGVHWSGDPSVDDDGTLYFSSDHEGPETIHIYRSRLVNGQYSDPEKLGPEINSEFSDSQPYISPNGKVLIFASTGSSEPPFKRRPKEIMGGGKPYPRADLYVSFDQNGKWTPARHLEHDINTEAEEEYPFLTPDGHYLFFSSERSAFTVPVAHRLNYRDLESGLHSTLNGHGNVFFIGVEALELPQ